MWRPTTSTAPESPDLYDLVSIAAEAVLEFQGATAVVVPTEIGRMARSIARFHTLLPEALETWPLPLFGATAPEEYIGGWRQQLRNRHPTASPVWRRMTSGRAAGSGKNDA